MATDADENDMLTYTLWYGTSADNITTQGKSSAPTKQGETVTIEQNEGLGNDTEYWFKVVVTDGVDEATSGECNENTYCKGEYCSGVSYSYETCTKCDSNHQRNCPYCNGLGRIVCDQELTCQWMRGKPVYMSSTYGAVCETCGENLYNGDYVLWFQASCPTHGIYCDPNGTEGLSYYREYTSACMAYTVEGKRCLRLR